MNILLLNDNPVVSKLITLCAQKTGNEILIVSNLEDIYRDSYDLLIVDETLYAPALFDDLALKISYKSSLYMLSRGVASVDGFEYEMKKPFLPTDLVTLLNKISLNIANIPRQNKALEIDLDSFFLEAMECEEGVSQSDEISSVLDQDDVNEIKNILDETDNEFGFDDFDFEEDFSLDELEEKIETAISILSNEDLEKEIDVALDALDEFSTLDEKSLKVALGEVLQEDLKGDVNVPNIMTKDEKKDGMEVLKTLLKALSNEDVVASLKGMNVSINISFGNNNEK